MEDHISYLLGKQVFLFRGTGSSTSAPMPSPDIALVLNYDLQLRKRVAKLVNESDMTLEKAFVEARKSPELKKRFFVTPLALQLVAGASSLSSSRFGVGAASGRPAAARSSKKRPRDDTRAGGRYTNFRGKLSDGTELCFAYNNEGCNREIVIGLTSVFAAMKLILFHSVLKARARASPTTVVAVPVVVPAPARLVAARRALAPERRGTESLLSLCPQRWCTLLD
eukprot:1597730-Amphidinium_carterae.1